MIKDIFLNIYVYIFLIKELKYMLLTNEAIYKSHQLK